MSASVFLCGECANAINYKESILMWRANEI